MKTGILISESWNVREVSVTGIAAHGICRLCDCLGKVLQLYRNARCNCIAGKSSDTAITLVGIAAPQFHLEGIACRPSQLQGNWQTLNYEATVIVPTDRHLSNNSISLIFPCHEITVPSVFQRINLDNAAKSRELPATLRSTSNWSSLSNARLELGLRLESRKSHRDRNAGLKSEPKGPTTSRQNGRFSQVRAEVPSVESGGKRVEWSCDKTLYDRKRGNYGGQSVKSKMKRKHDRSKFKV